MTGFKISNISLKKSIYYYRSHKENKLKCQIEKSILRFICHTHEREEKKFITKEN